MCGLGDCATQIKLKCDSCDGDLYAESSSGVTGRRPVSGPLSFVAFIAFPVVLHITHCLTDPSPF